MRGVMVGGLDSELRDPVSSPSRGYCVVFLAKMLYSYSVSIHSGACVPSNFMPGGNLTMSQSSWM